MLVDMFAKHDLALVSLSDSFDATTPEGRLMMHMLASVAQWEREAISKRSPTPRDTSATTRRSMDRCRSATNAQASGCG